MHATKPIRSTTSSTQVPKLTDGTTLTNPMEYHLVVGSLQYFSMTHPNLAFVVDKLSQFMYRLIIVHWIVIKQLLQYLRQYSSWALSHLDTPLTFHVFFDVDQPRILRTALPPLPMLFFQVIILLHGIPKSNILLLILPGRLNIGLQPPLLLNFYGSVPSYGVGCYDSFSLTNLL